MRMRFLAGEWRAFCKPSAHEERPVSALLGAMQMKSNRRRAFPSLLLLTYGVAVGTASITSACGDSDDSGGAGQSGTSMAGSGGNTAGSSGSAQGGAPSMAGEANAAGAAG